MCIRTTYLIVWVQSQCMLLCCRQPSLIVLMVVNKHLESLLLTLSPSFHFPQFCSLISPGAQPIPSQKKLTSGSSLPETVLSYRLVSFPQRQVNLLRFSSEALCEQIMNACNLKINPCFPCVALSHLAAPSRVFFLFSSTRKTKTRFVMHCLLENFGLVDSIQSQPRIDLVTPFVVYAVLTAVHVTSRMSHSKAFCNNH